MERQWLFSIHFTVADVLAEDYNYDLADADCLRSFRHKTGSGFMHVLGPESAAGWSHTVK